MNHPSTHSPPSKRLFIILGPCLFVLLLLTGGPADMAPEAWTLIACTAWIALWWLTEAVPIGITSLLPILLFSVTNVMPVETITGYYSNSIIFLFIAGFIIALAMEKWNLHRRIALNIIRLTGTNQKQVLLGFILATGLLSMWISNTATTMMMLPIALSIIDQVSRLLHNPDNDTSSHFGKALVIGIAYSASIGGLATIVGTPTNLIFAEAADQLYGAAIPFDKWFFFALPLSLILGAFLWWNLSYSAFKLSSIRVQGARQIIDGEIKKLGPMGYEERWVFAIFGLVALAWIFRSHIISPFFPGVNDTGIALVGAAVLFVVPCRQQRGEMLMDWPTAKRLPWEVILLFGGAFSVAGGFQETGLTQWFGGRLTLLGNIHPVLMLLIVVALVNYLTELTQNMATCTLMIPILAGLAEAINVHPYGLMVPMTIASSCAFMLPVATAPNAIVFGSGTLQMKDMVRAGFWLNIFATLLISVYTYYVLPLIWEFDFNSFPAELLAK